MTPKEKALELRQEFVFRINEYIEPKTWDEVESLNTLIYKAAKDCAELAVNEILDEIQPFELGYEYTSKIKFWNNVKQEIEKL
jgi:hypothetical protein